MKDQDEGEERIDENTSLVKNYRAVPNANKITTKYMTKYERARILGTRALQIRYANIALLLL